LPDSPLSAARGVAGAASRHRLVHIAGDSQRLLDRLGPIFAAPPRR
jgi:hypothetical protein